MSPLWRSYPHPHDKHPHPLLPTLNLMNFLPQSFYRKLPDNQRKTADNDGEALVNLNLITKFIGTPNTYTSLQIHIQAMRFIKKIKMSAFIYYLFIFKHIQTHTYTYAHIFILIVISFLVSSSGNLVSLYRCKLSSVS